MVFISHANPEDNQFSLWLALRLAREGYAVWCDLTKLLGGEDFWADIEGAIRTRTAKFLYVVSRTSNHKQGPLNELHVALNVARDNNLQDFVVPLHIDDLPHRDIQIQIGRLNAVPFEAGWAEGLRPLLKKLEQDQVPKDERFNPSSVASWWCENLSGQQLVRDKPDRLFSNWFPAAAPPATLYIHSMSEQAAASGWTFKWPVFGVNNVGVSFARAEELGLAHADTIEVRLEEALDPRAPSLPLDARVMRNAVQHLIRGAWMRFVNARPLPTHPLSNHRSAAYFPVGFHSGSLYPFTLENGFSGRRALTGKSSSKSARTGTIVERFWHFGISADFRFRPVAALYVKTHVLFSDNGKNIWESSKRLHRFRRSHCKDWWNDDWRDRLLAAMHWLARGERELRIPLAEQVTLDIRVLPCMFESPVTYPDQAARHADPFAADFEDFDDDDELGSDPAEVA